MVLCRLYEQVYHSFVVTEQERGLKDPRQPAKIIIQTKLVASCCKAYNEYRLHMSYIKCRRVVDADELGFSSMKIRVPHIHIDASCLMPSRCPSFCFERLQHVCRTCVVRQIVEANMYNMPSMPDACQ